MTKQVILELEERLVERAANLAISDNQSLSNWVNGLIDEAVRARTRYDSVRSEAIAALKAGYDLGGIPLGREASHER